MASARVAPVEKLTYIGFATNAVRAKTITFPDVSLGPDFPGRQIVLAIAAQTDSAAGDITAATVGGTPFTIDATSGITRGQAGIARGVFAGTSADIVLTAGSSTNQFYAGATVAVFALASGLAPVATAGGNCYDASVSIAGSPNGVTLISVASSSVKTLVSPPESTVIDLNPGGQARLAAHTQGEGPFLLDTSGGTQSAAYDRVAAVTYV